MSFIFGKRRIGVERSVADSQPTTISLATATDKLRNDLKNNGGPKLKDQEMWSIIRNEMRVDEGKYVYNPQVAQQLIERSIKFIKGQVAQQKGNPEFQPPTRMESNNDLVATRVVIADEIVNNATRGRRRDDDLPKVAREQALKLADQLGKQNGFARRRISQESIYKAAATLNDLYPPREIMTTMFSKNRGTFITDLSRAIAALSGGIVDKSALETVMAMQLEENLPLNPATRDLLLKEYLKIHPSPVTKPELKVDYAMHNPLVGLGQIAGSVMILWGLSSFGVSVNNVDAAVKAGKDLMDEVGKTYYLIMGPVIAGAGAGLAYFSTQKRIMIQRKYFN